jgi:hypothetical protein
MADDKQSFGEQAAKFSLYAPLVAIGLGIVTAGVREQSVMLYAIPILNLTLLVAGFILGIVALMSMKRFGTERILGRAIGGIVLNGIVLACLAALLLPVLAAGQVKTRIVQHWRLPHSSTAANNGPIDIAFSADGTYRMDTVSPTAGPLVVLGNWSMNRSQQIHITIVTVNGKPVGPPPKEMDLGIVNTVTADHLSLKTDNGFEEYDRVK